MQLFGFDRYKLYINEHFSYIAENGEIRKQYAMNYKECDGGDLMVIIANELDHDNCIAVDFGNEYVKFAYTNYDTEETDYMTINIRKEVEK